MSLRTDELKNRIEARKHELLAKLGELKADARAEAADRRDAIKQRLDEVEAYLKDGWENVSSTVEQKLNSWLDRDKDKGGKQN
jgi:hypothetical protein